MAASYNWLVDEDEILWMIDWGTASDERKAASAAAMAGGLYAVGSPEIIISFSFNFFMQPDIQCNRLENHSFRW